MKENPEIGVKPWTPPRAIDSVAHAKFVKNIFGILHKRPITSRKPSDVWRFFGARVGGIVK